jgi:glycosyltransferase involved in cell wall biosynthesis
MNVAVNAISAKVGGAATYLANVLPELQRRIVEDRRGRLVVFRGAGEGSFPEGIDYRFDAGASERAGRSGTLRRLWFDQVKLPMLLRREAMDVLFSSANFGPLVCPCRQVLLVRNTIYFDATFLDRAAARVRANYLAQRALVLASMAAADSVLFPSRAMLDLAASHAGGSKPRWRVAHYGTRRDLFHPPELQEDKQELARPGGSHDKSAPVRLLNVSLYCDQKNLGTLLSALRLLHVRDRGRYRLDLTAGFGRSSLEDNPMCPNFREERALYEDLHAAGVAFDTDWRGYTTLPDLYRSAGIFVFSSYTESFGHPLVEAMATGLPIVASDIPVNRELCGDAAVYFPTFDAEACAAAIQRVAEDPALRGRLREAALGRAAAFTWERHADALMEAFDGK